MTRSNRVPRDVTGVIGADPISHIGAMGTKSVEIAASDAKIRFSEMLRETERDKHFAIVRLGCPVARLIPAVDRPRTAGMGDLVKAFREVRGRVRGRSDVRGLIAERRRA